MCRLTLARLHAVCFCRGETMSQEAVGATVYDGFVSYSHGAVTHLAPALQQAVQRFATPWYRLRSVRLFRDDSALGANPELWPSIEAALQSSAWFVLLASPPAAASTWVRREVDWWLEHRSLNRLLIVLVDGHLEWSATADQVDAERTDALPPSLVHALTTEPRWVDLSFVRDQEQLDRREPRFVSGVADIAATLRDRPKDLLIGEDVRQHRRARVLARTAIATLSVLLLIAVVLGLVALSRTREVARQRDTALSGQFAAQADLVRDRDPQAALRLGVAALQSLPGGSADTPQNTAAVEGNLLETLSGRYRGSIPGRGKPLTASAWSPDGRTVAVGDAGGQLSVQSPGGVGPPHPPITVSSGGIASLAFSPDGRRIVVGSNDGGVSLVDLENGPRVVDGVHGGNGGVVATFTTQGNVVAAGGGQVLRWRPGGPPAHFPLGEPASSRLALSPNGTTLAVADFMSGVVTFWD